MANKRISDLNNLDGKISSGDLFLIQDVAPVSESKNVTWGSLMSAIAASASVDSASYSLTSSHAINILSASWASSSLSSSFASAGSGSGIYSISSSYADTASYASTASFASGSGVFAISSSYAFSSSFAFTGSATLSASYSISSSNASGSNIIASFSERSISSSWATSSRYSDYSTNGIETGYMVLYAGLDTQKFESSGSYLVCNGKDVFVRDYSNLYSVIGKKFGYYPEATMTAQRTNAYQPVSCYIDHDDVNIYGYALGSGIITFSTSNVSNGFWTITSAKTGQTRILSSLTGSAVFSGLGADEYRFIITEQNSQSSSVYVVQIHVRGENTTENFNLGPLPVITFTPSSTVEYHSYFSVTERSTDQTVDCLLRQTAPGPGVITQTSASLILAENQPFTCSVVRYSGSYSDITGSALRRSSKTLEFMGVNSPSFITTSSVFSATFFVPNVNVTGSIPENLSPKNTQIVDAGYNYAFSYLIKT